MSDFQRILSAAQLTKHYELLQFLTQHPNTEYTLAQLDTLLPHGVAVQRFPEAWFDLIESGACWHRSIELRRPPGSSTSSPPAAEASLLAQQEHAGELQSSLTSAPSAAAASLAVARRASYVLSCVKAEINTLDELRAMLESPSTLLDADGCVALHTDQIVITPELILRAQRTGLAYYFPDVYDKNEFRQFGVRDAQPTASPSTGQAATSGARATAALLTAFAEQEEKNDQQRRGGGGGGGISGGGGGVRERTYVALPPGVRVQHQLLTHRGVAEQEDFSLPTKLYVGERLRLVIDNAVAVRKLQQPNELQVSLTIEGVKASKLEKAGGPADVLMTEPPPPLRIRKESQAVRHTHHLAADAATKPNDGTAASLATSSDPPASSPAPVAMGPPAAVVVTTTVKAELEPLYAATLTLLLTVNGVENVLSVEVVEEAMPMPGVLILRDRQLDSFTLPQRDVLADPVVNPPMDTHYPYEAVLPVTHASSTTGASSSSSAPHKQASSSISAAQLEALKAGAWTELVPLPWTQNASPLVLSLRESTYPTQQHATVQAATRAVFSAQSLADEARLRQAKERVRREAEGREGGGSRGKRRRLFYRGNMMLSNRHLLHYGLDFSIPFSRPAS